jgi:cytochrome c biogenesis protein CcdA
LYDSMTHVSGVLAVYAFQNMYAHTTVDEPICLGLSISVSLPCSSPLMMSICSALSDSGTTLPALSTIINRLMNWNGSEKIDASVVIDVSV